MAKTVVSVAKGENAKEATNKAIALVGGMKAFVKRGDRVVIKPNITLALPPETGVTTDPAILGVIAELSFEAGAEEVTIAEGSGSSDLIEMNGLGDIAWRTGAKIVDINKLPEDQITNVKISNPLILDEIPIPRLVLEADVFVNVPKMKTSGMTVSLGLKNIMGVTPGKGQYFEWSNGVPRHPFFPAGGKKIVHDLRTEKGVLDGLLKALVDINQVVHSDLTVIDGIWALEGGGPIHGSPVKMGVIVCGENVVAVDSVGAAVMGFDPVKIELIKMAAESGLGTNDLKKIKITGETIEKVYRGFEPSNSKFYKSYSKSTDGFITQ